MVGMAALAIGICKMKTHAAALALLLFIAIQSAEAKPASVGVGTGFVRHNLPPSPLVYTFGFRSMSGDKVSVTIDGIIDDGSANNFQWRVTETTADDFGIDWAAWEAIINTQRTAGKLFGTVTLGDWVRDRGENDPMWHDFREYFDLNELVFDVSFNVDGIQDRFYAAGRADGFDTFVVPEPRSIVLLLVTGTCFTVFRRRKVIPHKYLTRGCGLNDRAPIPVCG